MYSTWLMHGNISTTNSLEEMDKLKDSGNYAEWIKIYHYIINSNFTDLVAAKASADWLEEKGYPEMAANYRVLAVIIEWGGVCKTK